MVDNASNYIPFNVTGWDFVYARSAAEYVVANYSAKPETRQSARNRQLRTVPPFDYDIETDPVNFFWNSHAIGLLVWRVDWKAFL